MPAYITEAGLGERFSVGEITDLAASDTDAVARACTDATSLIDGYLSSRYSLPLAEVPDIVAGWAADIARYRLWDDHAPEEVRRRYEDALAQLKLLSTGVISLPPGSTGVVATSQVAFAGYSAERVFTTDTLQGF